MAQAFRSTRVLTQQGLVPATLVVEAGRLAEVRIGFAGVSGAAVHDYGDAVLLPGLVDSHVHINEPGRTEWEGFWTATRAAAAGGVTTVVDMPLNCVPETTDVDALEAKRGAAHGKTWVDWAAWGGVVRGNADCLKPLAAAGVSRIQMLLDSLRHRRICVGRRRGVARRAPATEGYGAAAAGACGGIKSRGCCDATAQQSEHRLAKVRELPCVAAR